MSLDMLFYFVFMIVPAAILISYILLFLLTVRDKYYPFYQRPRCWRIL